MNKTVKVVLISLLIVILCLICFFASLSKEEKSNSSTKNDTEQDEILRQAISDAGDVSDKKRKEAEEIDVDEFIDLYNSDGSYAIVLSREGCEYCKLALPILENIIYEDKIDLKMIELTNLSSEDKKELLDLDSFFTNSFGTPLVLIVGDGQVKDSIEGLVSKNDYKELFKSYDLIK